MTNRDGPLTARQLVRILIVAGVVVAIVLGFIHGMQGYDHDNRVIDCESSAQYSAAYCHSLP